MHGGVCLKTKKDLKSLQYGKCSFKKLTKKFCHLLMPAISDQFGAWDTAGCREITSSNGRKDCECRQLGHFGILFVSLVESTWQQWQYAYLQPFVSPHGYRI